MASYASIDSDFNKQKRMIRHLYVHVPFCPRICPYCAFHVLRVNKSAMERFVGFLFSEYAAVEKNLELETIYFGGGTPTALSLEMLELVLKRMEGARATEGREWTLECNPSTLSPQKAKLLKSKGVNRLSIGAQSLGADVLKTLGRTHSVEAIDACFSVAREAGFANLNLDLIFGVPGQTLASWKETLRQAVAMGPEHLSCYGLTCEEDTDFFLRHQRGEWKMNPELEAEMFFAADEMLGNAGYEHYEISNFAKPGFRSKHNLAYWEGKDYYGLGPSAVSTIRGIRAQRGRWSPEGWKIESEEALSAETLASERLILGLRLLEGVDEVQFEKDFGFSPRDRWRQEICLLAHQGLLALEPQLHLTPRGRVVADEVAIYFCH